MNRHATQGSVWELSSSVSRQHSCGSLAAFAILMVWAASCLGSGCASPRPQVPAAILLFLPIGLFVSFLRVLYLFWIQVLYQISTLQIFSPVWGMSSHSKSIFWRAEVLNFDEAQLINFFLSWIVSLVSYLRILFFITQSHKDFFPSVFF